MDPRRITVDAAGSAEHQPDAATVELRVRGEGDSASDARTDAREQSNVVRNRLEDRPTDQIRAVNVEVTSTESMFEPDTDAPYQATAELHVDCAPDTAEAVAVDATDAGASVRNVGFWLAPETHESVTDEALTAAMERAREKAERLAAAEGLAVAEVRDVTTVEVSTEFGGIVDEALEWSEETNLHPAPITVSEGVEVGYELTEP